MMDLPKTLFWDTDFDSLDPDRNARYIIERVVMYGTLSDLRKILNYYGWGRVHRETLQSRELDPKSLSFLSCLFDTPPENYACFKQIQSSRAHWTF